MPLDNLSTAVKYTFFWKTLTGLVTCKRPLQVVHRSCRVQNGVLQVKKFQLCNYATMHTAYIKKNLFELCNKATYA